MSLFRKKIITREDGTPYLERTYYIKTKLFQIVKHKILQSDYDCLHDHPWNFISIILKGGYWEHTNAENRLNGFELKFYKEKYGDKFHSKWYGSGSVLFRNAEWRHKLELETWQPEKYHIGYSPIDDEILAKKMNMKLPCTTLVIMFKRRREWGFWTKEGWLPWFKYKSTSKCD